MPVDLTGNDLANLAYLVLLGSALLAIMLVRMRGSMVKALQNLTVWGLIFVGIIAAYGVWDDIRGDLPIQSVSSETGQIILPRARDGHYYLTADVNGTATRFVVDTGATDIVLTQEAARAAGIDVDGLQYFGRALTANGEVSTARVVLDSIDIDGIQDRKVTASVNGGQLRESLLGMRYLQRFEKIEITGNRLILTR